MKRQGLFVWVKNLKNARKLRRYGHMITVSKKEKYVLIYVNQTDAEDTIEAIHKLPFVTKVEPSYKPFIKTEYEKVDLEKTKEVDYKYGI